MRFDGTVLERGDDGYEQARQEAAWNSRKPARFPEGHRPRRSEADVVNAVALAREHGLKVKARAGGHSWSASGIRSGMLIDLSQMTQVSFDAASGVASVQPGVKGRDLNAMLAEHDLFFPSGTVPRWGSGAFCSRAAGAGIRARSDRPV